MGKRIPEDTVKAYLQCEDCLATRTFDVGDEVNIDGELVVAGCDGLRLVDLQAKFGKHASVEELALELYDIFHFQAEDSGWTAFSRERSDEVVRHFRKLAIMINDITRDAGIGSCYYD